MKFHFRKLTNPFVTLSKNRGNESVILKIVTPLRFKRAARATSADLAQLRPIEGHSDWPTQRLPYADSTHSKWGPASACKWHIGAAVLSVDRANCAARAVCTLTDVTDEPLAVTCRSPLAVCAVGLRGLYGYPLS